MAFPIEKITDNCFTYHWVHENEYQDEVLSPNVFRNKGLGMSGDWNKYSTPQATRNRVANYGRDPFDFGVISLFVKSVRAIDSQTVDHDPKNHNQAHSEIRGVKSEMILLEFLDIYEWEINI